MPMQGSKPSKVSKELGNIMAQLKSGKTRGSNPRDLEPEDIEALEQKRDTLKAEIKQKAKERAIAKINAHATTETDRVIGAVQKTAAPANAYFEAIGGAGSSVDLRLQGKAPLERAREQERQAKCMQTEERRAAAKEKANGFRSLSTADLRAKLDAAGLDSSGSKTALVKRLLSAPSAAASGGAAGGPETVNSRQEDNGPTVGGVRGPTFGEHGDEGGLERSGPDALLLYECEKGAEGGEGLVW